MNGESQALFKAIKDWSKEVHEQRHRENLTKFDLIFEKLDKLLALKSDVDWLTWSVRIFWIVGVLGIIGAIIRKAIAG